METGAKQIIELLDLFLKGKISGEKVGDDIRNKVLIYKCNRQKLLHMSLKTLIQGKIPPVESVEGQLVRITKDSSLVKAQAKDGLIVYVITNTLVPPPPEEE